MIKPALLLVFFLSAAAWGEKFKILISPPLSPTGNAPALRDARYFLKRFIFYFSPSVTKVTWNGQSEKLAPLDDGSASVIHITADTSVFPIVNNLDMEGKDGVGARRYLVTFVKVTDHAELMAQLSPTPVAMARRSSDSDSNEISRFYTPRPRGSLRLVSFEAMALGLLTPDGNNGFAPLVAWTPQYHYSSSQYVSISVGFSPVKTLMRDFFVATEYQAHWGYQARVWAFNAGGGIQIWHQRAGANPIVSAGVRYYHGVLRDRSQAWLLAGYSAYLPAAGIVHELRLGLGFEL